MALATSKCSPDEHVVPQPDTISRPTKGKARCFFVAGNVAESQEDIATPPDRRPGGKGLISMFPAD